MSWRPTSPYTVINDPTLWSHEDLRHIPLAVAHALVNHGVQEATQRAIDTELDWDTRLCHGLLLWDWAQHNRGADRLLNDLKTLATQRNTMVTNARPSMLAAKIQVHMHPDVSRAILNDPRWTGHAETICNHYR